MGSCRGCPSKYWDVGQLIFNSLPKIKFTRHNYEMCNLHPQHTITLSVSGDSPIMATKLFLQIAESNSRRHKDELLRKVAKSSGYIKCVPALNQTYYIKTLNSTKYLEKVMMKTNQYGTQYYQQAALKCLHQARIH